MKGRISEIFSSIQGEGPYVGQKQIFVRLSGCNLDCRYCDTKTDDHREYEPQALLDKIKSFGREYHYLSFTGGEPLLQKDFLKEALELTRKAGFKNYLETNGTLPEALAEVIDGLDIVAMDFKFPSSTGQKSFWPEHRKFLEISSGKDVFIKAVICSSTSEEDLRQAIKVIKEVNPKALLVLQPDSSQEYSGLAENIQKFKAICAQENISACIIPQVHKILGVR
jgi:7-carboxy-7-deazaguanine synthase